MPTHRFASCRTTLQCVFEVLTATVVFLTIGAWGVGHTEITKTGGYLGVLTALLAWYDPAAGVTSETQAKVVMPVGPSNN